MSLLPLAAVLLLGARCGGEAAARTQEVSTAKQGNEAKSAPAIDACSLLTAEEIEAVTGAKSVGPKKDAYGSVGTCNFHAADQLLPVVSVVLAPGMPEMSSSAEMAAWRSKQAGSWGGVKLIIEPVEGLGVPAIRNEVEGAGMVTVEAGVRGMLLDITTSSLERSKALATKAMARLP
jgi:hypothetical protein